MKLSYIFYRIFIKILKRAYFTIFIILLSDVNVFSQTPTLTQTPNLTQASSYITHDSLQSVTAGCLHTCGITTDTDKSVYCWGGNYSGQLGNNSTISSSIPVKVVGGEQGGAYLAGVTQVSSSDSHVCAVTSEGMVYCWGINDYAQLGRNDYYNSGVPIKVMGGGSGRNIFK